MKPCSLRYLALVLAFLALLGYAVLDMSLSPSDEPGRRFEQSPSPSSLVHRLPVGIRTPDTALDPYELRLDCLNLVSSATSQDGLARACVNRVIQERSGGRSAMALRSWADLDHDNSSDAIAAPYFFSDVQAMLNETMSDAEAGLFSDILLSPEAAPPIIDVHRPDRPHHASRSPFPVHLLHPSLQKDLAPYWETGISLASLGGAMNRLYNSVNDYEFGRVVPIAIVDGYAVYQDKAMSQTGKSTRLRKQLKSVLAALRNAGRRVPNVLMLQVLDSIPPGPFFHPPTVHLHVPPELRGREDVAPLVPVLAIAASRSGWTPSAIRVPNMYFGELHLEESKGQAVHRACADLPFANRTPQAMWRGDSFSSSSNRFHHARNQALVLQAQPAGEELVNLRLVQPEKECRGARLTIRRWQAHGLLSDEVADRMVATECGEHLFIRHEDFCRYRYVLNLPGSSAGSYSRNLQTLFKTGSTVLHWDNDAVEWYYERLEHNVNYLVVDQQTLLPTVRELNEDPARAEAIATAGLKVLDRELSTSALVDFYEQLFQALAALQRFDVDASIIVDSACACGGTRKGQPLYGIVPKCTLSC